MKLHMWNLILKRGNKGEDMSLETWGLQNVTWQCYEQWRRFHTLFSIGECKTNIHIKVMNINVWKQVVREELRSIKKNHTGELNFWLEKKRTIDVEWVYKTKLNPYGSTSKYKARLVAIGFLYKHGINCNEVFSLVSTLEIIILVVTITNSKKLASLPFKCKVCISKCPTRKYNLYDSTSRFCNEREIAYGICTGQKVQVWIFPLQGQGDLETLVGL